MIREISWYLEKNRFSDIVNDLETKAEAYAASLIENKKDSEKLREEFRQLCQWHMEKSGYRSAESNFINVDLEFFNGADVNKEALHTFEKEIIKAHMYQKHLWEFMGTTGCMTVISKLGMKKDGFIYDNYLPIEYKKNHKPKSPISNILKENPDAVPIYTYLDGTISTEYNPEKSKAQFDVLKDKSGFDWTRKGWDPNYEVEKKDWKGQFDENGNWIMVRTSGNKEDEKKYAGAKFQKVPVIELIKDGNTGILYDPENSLLSPFQKIYILTNGQIYGAETQDVEKTVSLIKDAMKELNIKQITTVNGTKETSVKLYKKLFDESFSDNAIVKNTNEILKTKEKIIQKELAKKIKSEGEEFSAKVQKAILAGEKNDEIIRTVNTNKIHVPYSIYNKEDCKKLEISEDYYNVLTTYPVPEEKKSLFSATIINLLRSKELLQTSGKSAKDFFDAAFSEVVEGTKSQETVSIETTFEDLCLHTDKIITGEQVEKPTVQKLIEAKNNLEITNASKRTEIYDAIDNVIRNFSAVRMSTGFTPEEAVRKAAEVVSNTENKINADNIMNSGFKPTRIFSDVSLSDIIKKAQASTLLTKEADITNFKVPKNNFEIPNLFNKTERNTWYESESFKQSGFTKESFEFFTEIKMTDTKNSFSFIEPITFTQSKNFDKHYNYDISPTKNQTIIANIQSATKLKPVDTVVEELNQNSSQKYEAAQIKTDGRIERKFDFEKEIVEPEIRPVVHYPVQTKPTEAERMAKINANYEHDKRVLAKKDPMFAKNKMWDVGHAEESGEMTDREMRKMGKMKSPDLINDVRE